MLGKTGNRESGKPMTLIEMPVADTGTGHQSTGLDFTLTVLGSGSSGNCSLVSFGDIHLLIDAGFSAKQIGIRMAAAGFDMEHLTAILVTHEHSDHVKSAHTISRRQKIPVLCTSGTFHASFAEKALYDWVEIKAGIGFDLGKMSIHPISLPHDAADPIGFRIECGDRILGHITDFGYPSALVRESLRGCDTLLTEANHDLDLLKDGPYPWSLKQRIASRLGHLSNESLFEMLPDILHDGVRHLVLAHLSETNNNPKMLQMQLKRQLQRLGLPNLPFTIAKQDEPLEPLTI